MHFGRSGRPPDNRNNSRRGNRPAGVSSRLRPPKATRRSTQRVTSDRPFVERLVAFWSNHLCVSTGAKVLVAPLAGSYEREAIRPHVLGRFEDMVLASARHPAMLVYLDNFQSIGPNSRGGQFSGRGGRGQKRGLNENYARELLELHTLGVDGGYTQQDVQELAKILTGWTVAGLVRGAPQVTAQRGRRPNGRTGATPATADPDRNGPIGFTFQALLHEPGAKTVLGVKYGDDGEEEGERVIRALCRHPSTARFVATKLVTHFVGDQPPAAAVDRIARVFRDSDGDLRAVSLALVDLDDAWSEGATEVPHAAGLARRRAPRVQRAQTSASRCCRCCVNCAIRSGRRNRPRGSGTRRRNGPIPIRC